MHDLAGTEMLKRSHDALVQIIPLNLPEDSGAVFGMNKYCLPCAFGRRTGGIGLLERRLLQDDIGLVKLDLDYLDAL